MSGVSLGASTELVNPDESSPSVDATGMMRDNNPPIGTLKVIKSS